MKSKISIHIAVLTLMVALLTASSITAAGLQSMDSLAGAPGVVSYQGKVTVGGVPFNGTGYFKFAFVDIAGTTSYWSNNGTSSGGVEPDAAVLLSVVNGFFTVLLGDTSLAGMTQPLEASVFSGSERYLRVWFSDDGVNFNQLLPDQRVASAPYALQAVNADLLDGLQGNAYQQRVISTCAVGSSIRVIHEDGTVECDAPTTWYYPILFPQSLNLMSVSTDWKGFYGGFSDGRYAYLAPNENENGKFGMVVRLDTQNFTTGGVTNLDLTAVDPTLKGFHGGFTDGRYGYFVPHANPTFFSGMVARVDLQNFTQGGVTTLNLANVDSQLVGFHGGFTDGRYAYFVPLYNGAAFSGKIARVDLFNFTTTGVSTLNLAAVNPGLVGFFSGFTDGRYGYFVPYQSGVATYHGKIARVDLSNFTTTGVTMLDLQTVDTSLKGYHGGFTDGRYGYFLPGYNGTFFSGTIVRVDLQDFSASGVRLLDLTTVDDTLRNIYGGITDGRYGYFVPTYTDSTHRGGKLARVDLNNFTPAGVAVLDMEAMDSSLKGFYGIFSDGQFAYLVPNNYAVYHGTVARFPLFFGNGTP